jgi:transposase
MIEHRQRLLAERTRAKNQVRALLRRQGLVAPKGLWTQRGMAWLEKRPCATTFGALQRDLLAERIRALNEMLKRVDKALWQKAKDHPGIAHLMGIPGVGIRTAEAVIAYLDDPGRFSRNSAVGCYFGLVPCLDSSAGKDRFGHITRQGPPTVRKLLIEAAWQGIRRSPILRAYFERIMQGHPDRKKIAITATAHYLVRVMHAMLRTGEVWRSSAA